MWIVRVLLQMENPPSYSAVKSSDNDVNQFIASLGAVTRKKKDLERSIIKNENEQSTLYFKINLEKNKMKESTIKLTGYTVRKTQLEEEWRALQAENQRAVE